jgi:hypothetical protein
MRRHSRWVLLMLAVVFLFAMPLPAGDFTLYAGKDMPGSINKDVAGTVKKITLDGSPIFGVRFSKNFVPLFGMEHSLAFSSDYLYPKNISDVTSAKGFAYSANFILGLPIFAKFAVPYVTAGAGLLHQYGDRNLPVGTKFAFNYGGGVKAPHLLGPLGLRFDMRGYTSGLFSNKLNMLEVTGGILVGK